MVIVRFLVVCGDLPALLNLSCPEYALYPLQHGAPLELCRVNSVKLSPDPPVIVEFGGLVGVS